MPAGPIGACWANGSWSATAWEANTWSGAGASIPATLRDLTTLTSTVYLPALRVALAVGAAPDSTTLLQASLRASVQAFDSEDDLNTAAAKYIESTY